MSGAPVPPYFIARYASLDKDSSFVAFERVSNLEKVVAPCKLLRNLSRAPRNDELVTRYGLARPQCFGYHRSMKSGPDIAMVASLVGDPARANMLTALMTAAR